ncbi:MAG: hypothetical protein IMX00_04420 [Limnochordales bacterium]|nr:hypothetical protein [Limnochordales bacterium]
MVGVKSFSGKVIEFRRFLRGPEQLSEQNGQNQQEQAEPVQQQSVGKCIRCGRKLTDPSSVQRGMGPVCWGKSLEEMALLRQEQASLELEQPVAKAV